MRAYAISLVFVSIAVAGRVTGQTPPTAPGAQPPAAAEPQRPPAEQPGETYTYQPDGRRDPFLNLLGTGLEPAPGMKKGEGPGGMMVSEISVRGIMQSKGGLVAMVAGPDNKTYIVRQGDRFLDGKIKTVTPQGLIIIQEVNDPLSVVKQREIRKLLRSLEDGKA
jgi:Tfp pilus assembly protein PilP